MLVLLAALTLMLSGVRIADMLPSAAPLASTAALPSVPDINHQPVVLAADQFNTLQHAQIDRDQYTPTASAAFTDALVAQTAAYLVRFGSVKAIKLDSSLKVQSNTVYHFTLTCSNGMLQEMLALDKDDRIDGIRFMPQ